MFISYFINFWLINYGTLHFSRFQGKMKLCSYKMEIYYKIRGDKILNNRNQIKVVGMHRVSGYESCIPDRYPAGHPVGPDTGFQSRNPTILKLEFTCNKIF